MTKITVNGLKPDGAPNPLLRRIWHDDWSPRLAGLTAWEESGGGREYSCTTAANKAATSRVVDEDLTKWLEEDPGHRSYKVTD